MPSEGVDRLTVIRHAPRGIRASAEDCENAGLVAAAETLRNLADEVEVSRPALEGAVAALENIVSYAYGASGATGDDAGHLTAVGMMAKEALAALRGQ
jgi:hypothetical protein